MIVSKDSRVGVKFFGETEPRLPKSSTTTTATDVSVVLPHHKLENVVNQSELIASLRQETEGLFVYMVYAVPRSSEHYTPYALT